jgi:glycosyltransferase involved in cell wall biosynthesis
MNESAKSHDMKLLLVLGAPLTYSQAPSSRLIYIADSIKKKSFSIELMGFKGEELPNLKTTTVTGIKHIARIKLLATLYKKAATATNTHIIIRGASFAFFLIPLKVLGTRIILDFHGWMYREINLYYKKNLYNKLKVVIYYLLEKMAVRFSDILICTSRGVIELLGENGKKKSIIIENGLDIKEAQNVLNTTEKEREKILEKHSIPERKPLLGFMGNWERQLDMELVFKACKIAGINMIVVGEGSGIDLFREKWKNNITFTGRLPRLKGLKIISVCDATIVPYKEDHTVPVGYFSQRKVKDYLGLGKPILMANVRGRERFLIPYENAVFYHPNNPKDLAGKIKILVSNKKLRKKMQKNNLKLARRFDWQILVEKSGLLELLEN